MGLGRLLGHQGGFYAGGDYYGGSKRSRARRETVRSKEAARGKKLMVTKVEIRMCRGCDSLVSLQRGREKRRTYITLQRQ